MLKQIIVSAAFMAFGFGAAAANEGPLTNVLTQYVITVDESGEETKTQSEDASPGEMVEYVLSYENTGEGELSGLVISAPVPVAMTFVAGSAMTEEDATFEVSVDEGATWSTTPVMIATDDGEKEVPVSEYDFVRWMPKGAIEGGERWDFTYRVTVQ